MDKLTGHVAGMSTFDICRYGRQLKYSTLLLNTVYVTSWISLPIFTNKGGSGDVVTVFAQCAEFG